MEQNIIERLDAIERNTLLAAKSVLTIDDVSLLTGISKSTLYKMTCRKLIPHYKPTGKLLFFERKEVEEWALSNRVNTWVEAEQQAEAFCAKSKV